MTGTWWPVAVSLSTVVANTVVSHFVDGWVETAVWVLGTLICMWMLAIWIRRAQAHG